MEPAATSPSPLGLIWLALSSESQALLRELLPPRFEQEFYHHVTLRYGISRKPEVEDLIGTEHTVTAFAQAHDNRAQAVRVHALDLPDEYGVPHITLSTAPGVKPFHSVTMLQGEHHERMLPEPITLSGRIEFIALDNVTD